MAKRTGGFIGQDGINAPDQATGVSASGGNTQATVSFTAPSNVGGAAVTSYRVTDTTGAFGASGSTSPVNVTGLTNGTSYTFNVWAINPFGWSSPSDASGSVSPAAPNALFFGATGDPANVIEYIVIETTGNSADFGDLIAVVSNNCGLGSSTRGISAGGFNASFTQQNRIEYMTIASAGNATDFGDLLSSKSSVAGLSNATRGIISNGEPSTNEIDYITIASAGNATDFGNSTLSQHSRVGTASTTRGVVAGAGNYSNVIDYITIGSTGNALDFGDLDAALSMMGACASSTRGVFAGGNDNQGDPGNIQYITIASQVILLTSAIWAALCLQVQQLPIS